MVNMKIKQIAEGAVWICLNCMAYGLIGFVALAFGIAICHGLGWSTDWVRALMW